MRSIGMINDMLQTKLLKNLERSIGMINGMLQDKVSEDLVNGMIHGRRRLSEETVHSIGRLNGLLQTKLSEDLGHSIGRFHGMLQDQLAEDPVRSPVQGASELRSRRCRRGGLRPRRCSSSSSCQLHGGRIPERARHRLPRWARWQRLPVPRAGGSSSGACRRLPMSNRRHLRLLHPLRPRSREPGML